MRKKKQPTKQTNKQTEHVILIDSAFEISVICALNAKFGKLSHQVDIT